MELIDVVNTPLYSNSHYLLNGSSSSHYSIIVGLLIGLLTSFLYKHTRLYEYPRFETAILFLFCYLCYSLAESMELSGIMALFFNGILLSHYNSYNLSEISYITAEQIFATLAVVAETLVFLYMGLR